LQSLLNNDDARWKSTLQGQMVDYLVRGKRHLLIVLPTGGGKTLAMALPSLIEPEGITVVVVPFVALMEDLKIRLSNYGVLWGTYGDLELEKKRVILVSLEVAADENFVRFCGNVQGCGLLKRIILDEAHHFLMSPIFRPAFLKFRHLVSAAVPLALCTATMPPKYEQDLWTALKVSPRTTITLREDSTARPEISYRVTKVDPDDVEAKVVEYVNSVTLREEERGIIYCNTIAAAQHLAKAMGVEAYISNLTLAKKNEIMRKWVGGEQPWLIGTSAIGVGIDYPHVCYVVHAEPSYTLIDYAQETGRAGRDGKPSVAQMICSGPPLCSRENYTGYGGYDEMVEWVELLDACRRYHMGQFLDGIGRTCGSTPNGEFCTYCAGLLVRCLLFVSYSSLCSLQKIPPRYKMPVPISFTAPLHPGVKRTFEEVQEEDAFYDDGPTLEHSDCKCFDHFVVIY
ncbi:P-loop containing nucleoside triphosphate hydrolase protein, partial [Rickenella mellea]